MDDVFLKLVNLSISASWLILAVLVLRVVLKKAPKWVMPLLWVWSHCGLSACFRLKARSRSSRAPRLSRARS